MTGPTAGTKKRGGDVALFPPSTPTKKGKTAENHLSVISIEGTSPGDTITRHPFPAGDGQWFGRK